MLKLDSYEYICTTSQEIPEVVNPYFRPELRKALGNSVRVMFPDFAKAFPLTVDAMEVFWSRPVAGFKQVIGQWLSVLLLERDDLNLFFELSFVGYQLDGPDYDQSHKMLPLNWRQLYRWFESFAVTEGSAKPMNWWNTPFAYSSRLSLDEYREGSGASKSQIRAFSKKIGSENLMCWLLTEAGDALFLDETRCDHKVYHVRATAFDDVFVLPDPDKTLDRYLAHYVSGNSPADFDFRN
jgi:hypothetical protein